METVRMERGEYGEEAVPSHAYYGVRTKRALERLTDTGKDYKRELLVAMAALKKNAARIETESGRLTARTGALLERAAQEIADGRWHEQFVFEPGRCGSGRLLSRNMSEVMANRALELLGEDKGSYHIVSTEWHSESPLYPNRYFTAAFQLAALDYVSLMLRTLRSLPPGIAGDAASVLLPLQERLCRLNGEHFDGRFIANLANAAGLPLTAARSADETYETVYGSVTAAMKRSIASFEPAINRIDSVELKAGMIQISTFRDMVTYMARSGLSAQGMEEVAAYYAWQCLDLCCRATMKINQIYH